MARDDAESFVPRGTNCRWEASTSDLARDVVPLRKLGKRNLYQASAKRRPSISSPTQPRPGAGAPGFSSGLVSGFFGQAPLSAPSTKNAPKRYSGPPTVRCESEVWENARQRAGNSLNSVTKEPREGGFLDFRRGRKDSPPRRFFNR